MVKLPPKKQKGLITVANKITNRDYFNMILSNIDSMTLICEGKGEISPDSVREWAKHQIDLLDRKNVNKKPTAQQAETADIMAEVEDFLGRNQGKVFTCAELLDHGLFPASAQSQRAAAICNKLVAAGRAEKGVLKGKTVFMANGTFDTIQGIKEWVSKSSK